MEMLRINECHKFMLLGHQNPHREDHLMKQVDIQMWMSASALGRCKHPWNGNVSRKTKVTEKFHTSKMMVLVVS